METNLTILVLMVILTTPVITQYNGIKPDVTIGDHNERFDVSDLMSQQNKYFRADGSIDYRRSHGFKKRHKFLRTGLNSKDEKWLLGTEKGRMKYAKRIKKEAEEQLNKLANIILLRMTSLRRTGEDFAYHDNMENGGGDIYEFNENLAQFNKHSRRSNNEEVKNYRKVGTAPEMFNYAFPIDMEVKGYLVPAEDQ